MNSSHIKSNKANASTNVNEPTPDHANYSKENEIDEKNSFPQIEIETTDSFWNSGNGNNSQGSLCDLGDHQRNSSNIFDSAIFDESEIDIENASFVSEISSLAFSSSNVSSLQSPTRRNRYSEKDSSKHGKRKKKNKNRFMQDDDFSINSVDKFYDYFRSYEEPFMPVVLSKRWNEKPLKLRKEVVCAYRAEDARIMNIDNENIQQKLREEEVRREKIADYDISIASSQNILERSVPTIDSNNNDNDIELEFNQNQSQLSSIHDSNDNSTQIAIDSQNSDERGIKANKHEIESIENSLSMNKKVNPILIFSLAIRFFFYIGYLLNLC